MAEFKTPTERIRGIQLAIYKHGRRFEVGKAENKSSKWPGRDPTLGSLDCESNALIMLPPTAAITRKALSFFLVTKIWGYFDYADIC